MCCIQFIFTFFIEICTDFRVCTKSPSNFIELLNIRNVYYRWFPITFEKVHKIQLRLIEKDVKTGRLKIVKVSQILVKILMRNMEYYLLMELHVSEFFSNFTRTIMKERSQMPLHGNTLSHKNIAVR